MDAHRIPSFLDNRPKVGGVVVNLYPLVTVLSALPTRHKGHDSFCTSGTARKQSFFFRENWTTNHVTVVT
jgi:hypothetical protein